MRLTTCDTAHMHAHIRNRNSKCSTIFHKGYCARRHKKAALKRIDVCGKLDMIIMNFATFPAKSLYIQLLLKMIRLA